MKKLTKIISTIGIAAIISGCTGTSQNVEPMEVKMLNTSDINSEINNKLISLSTKVDLEEVCSIEKNGIESVISITNQFNNTAIATGLEFRRLGVNNSALIESVEEAIKTGAKEVNPKDFKGKASKTKLETNYAAQRACKFAIVALQQSVEAKKTWRLSIPGDGFKY